MTLKAKQVLVKAAKLTQQKEEKINKKEIEKKINQIKYLSGKKKISKVTLKKQINSLEKQLKGVLLLEKKLKTNKKKDDKKIQDFKKQIRSLKKKLVHAKDVSLRKKVNKLSHLIGDLVAKQDVKKEVTFEKKKNKLVSHSEKITVEKIYELKKRLVKIRDSGKYSPDKIDLMEKKLFEMEKKLDLSPQALPTSPTGIPRGEMPMIKDKAPVKHKLMFGPEQKEAIKEIKPKLDKLEDDIDELPIPPPPRIKKK